MANAEAAELTAARVRALCEQRTEFLVKIQELALEISRIDLELLRTGIFGSFASETSASRAAAIGGTIGGTMGLIGGTIGGTTS